MKTMTKVIAGAFTAAAIFIGSNVNAQTTPANKLRLGVGLETGVPVGDVNSVSKFELGGTARLQYGITDNFALMLTTGYYNFFSTKDAKDLGRKSLGVIPAKFGAKGFLAKNFYVSGEVGAGFTVHPPYDPGNKLTKFIWSPGIGYANQTWDVGVRYENLSGGHGTVDDGANYGIVGLRIAYGFPL